MVVTLPTAPKICCCTTSRKFTVHVAFFAYWTVLTIKGSYQTHGANFITSQLIIKISPTVLWVCGVSAWLNTRSTFSSVWALCGPPLTVSLLIAPVSVSELYQQPVNATFCQLFVWKFIR